MAQSRREKLEEAIDKAMDEALGQVRAEYEESIKWVTWMKELNTPVGWLSFVGMLYGLFILGVTWHLMERGIL